VFKFALNPRALYPHPVLLLEGQANCLAISDLHLGFEFEIAEKGITFRSPVLSEMLSELAELIDSHSAKRLIILGDLKHTVGSINKQEWDDVPTFLKRLCAKVEVYLVPGNHDSNIRHLLPDNVNFMSSAGMALEDTFFTHGHAALPQQIPNVARIITGHSHPVFLKRSSVLSGKQVWVSLRLRREVLFNEGKDNNMVDVIVLPSFNKYLYATGEKRRSRNGARYFGRKTFSPIISKIANHKESVIRCLITTLDGEIVGNEEMLPYVLGEAN
jgi:putative SbcD/Mre11-related phosphoesterase